MNNDKLIPTAPNHIPAELMILIRAIGDQWKASAHNPLLCTTTSNNWTTLVKEWSEDSALPLLIRNAKLPRGVEVLHRVGRSIIICDNATAQWVMMQLFKKKVYSLREIADLLAADKIPVGYALKKSEKEVAKYKRVIGKDCINKYGWKLCHIERVGLNDSTPMDEIEIEKLKANFRLFLDPANFFVIPKVMGGIGEISEFIACQRN